MNLHKVNIRPLSINCAFQGKRFKTVAYKTYEDTVLKLLPKLNIPLAPYYIEIELGFSSKLSDIDNPIKLILDILQKKYLINDRDIYKLKINKSIVSKGAEFFKFKIESLLK